MSDAKTDGGAATADDIVQRYRSGERIFRELELPEGASFRGKDLSGAFFEGCWFLSVDFSEAVLRGTSFRGSHLKCCDFAGADLTGADLRDSGIDGATFTNARVGTGTSSRMGMEIS